MTILAWLGAAALGGSAGHYHPNDLARQSTRFATASGAMAESFESRNRASAELAVGLRAYRENLDLLGDRAPVVERERLELLERQYNRQRAVFAAFSNTLVEDFDREFTDAVERAKVALGATVEVCEAQIGADGPRLPGMPSRTRPNPACTGDDLNAALAARIDADPVLDAAISEIASLTWPPVDLPRLPQAPVGGGDRHVEVRDLLGGGARDALLAIDRADDEARAGFHASIEEGADKEALAGLVAEAKAVTAATAARRASLGAPVMSAATEAIGRWTEKGEPATGWCAQPVLLGGCTGENAGGALVPRLLADKKVSKAFP